MQVKKFLINEALAQMILDYLKTRPYVEVYKMVDGLRGLPLAPGYEDAEREAGQPDPDA